jgi:Family of unknown function (DUF6084)
VPDLGFRITGAEPAARGLTPLLHFKLEITNAPSTERIHAVILQAQIQIQSPQRRYNDQEKEKLLELFGTPDRWGQTLRNKLWAHTGASLGQFIGRAETVLPVQCTYDLNVIATKYFQGLETGEVPLLFLFSGTVFYAGPEGQLQVQPIPWDKECTFRMPLEAWQLMMERHYPNSAWIALHRDVFERLCAYRRRHGFATWEQAIEQLLPAQTTKTQFDPGRDEP